MSFDGLFLHHMINEFSDMINARIQKIYQISNYEFLFHIRCDTITRKLFISIQNESARIHYTTFEYDTPPTPSSFTMLLRKHLEGGIIKSIRQINSDRIICLDILSTNEMKDKVLKTLIVELTGRHSNLILVEDDVILEASKHIHPFENDHRTIMPKAIYKPLKSNKVDTIHISKDVISSFFMEHEFITSKDIASYFDGLSMLGANEIMSVFNKEAKLNSYLDHTTSPSFITKGSKQYFYFQDLKHLDGITTSYPSLSELLDTIFYLHDKVERIKQKSNDIYKFVVKQIEKNLNKINKLKLDLQRAKDSSIYKLYGELLLANSHIKNEDKSKIKVLNYYDNTDVWIPLDEKINIVSNANKYFIKYQKAKAAISHLDNQIIETNEEITYFTLLKAQLESCDVEDALEIKNELIQQKYVKASPAKGKVKKQPSYLTFYTSDNTTILVGKNNLQNEYLTHKLAQYNEMWFHVKNAPGSHVIVRKTAQLSESDIRTAAMLAAIYSTYRDSSSVPVDYTLIKHIKKIPGKRNCFVSYTNEKTIYIDPDINFINKLKTKM